MSDQHPDWSRRRLLQYGGVGAALALAGCSTGDDDDDTEDTDNGDGTNGDGDEGLPEDPSTAFELAGDGSEPYRDWLVPDLTIESGADGEQTQLYQFNDYERSAERELSDLLDTREQLASTLGIEPESIERELLLGPLASELPYRVFFGSFDTEVIAEAARIQDREQTGEDGEFTIYDDSLAVSEDVVMEHPDQERIIEHSRGEPAAFEGIEDEMQLLLDLIPEGPQITLNRRDDHDDIVVDAMTIFEVSGGFVVEHGIWTFVFDDASSATSERIQEMVLDNSNMNEIVTEEIQGRVAMVEAEL